MLQLQLKASEESRMLRKLDLIGCSTALLVSYIIFIIVLLIKS